MENAILDIPHFCRLA